MTKINVNTPLLSCLTVILCTIRPVFEVFFKEAFQKNIYIYMYIFFKKKKEKKVYIYFDGK